MSTPQTLTGSDVSSDLAKNKANIKTYIGGLTGFLALSGVLLNSSFVEWGNIALIPAAIFFLVGAVLAAYAAWSTVDIYSLPLDTECPDTLPPAMPPMRGPDIQPLRPRIADPLTAIPLGPPQQYRQTYSSTFPYAPSAASVTPSAPVAPSAPALAKIDTPSPDMDNPPSYDEVVRPGPYYTPDRSFRRVFDPNTKYSD